MSRPDEANSASCAATNPSPTQVRFAGLLLKCVTSFQRRRVFFFFFNSMEEMNDTRRNAHKLIQLHSNERGSWEP